MFVFNLTVVQFIVRLLDELFLQFLNQHGKGLWAKIPADGHTTLTKPYLAGQSEDGKNIWKDEKTTVSNRELKSMVEFYKKDLVPKYDIPEL